MNKPILTHKHTDYAAGDLICKGCGLVLGDRIVDEHSEWRTFSNSDSTGADPNRVGGPSNPLLRDSGLSTIIGRGEGAAASLSRWQNRGAVCCCCCCCVVCFCLCFPFFHFIISSFLSFLSFIHSFHSFILSLFHSFHCFTISKPVGSMLNNYLHLQLGSGDRSLLAAFKEIGRMTDRMSLPQTIRV
jgi:hypothetical protein